MAVGLGPDQPLYALQAWGLNGVDEADPTIEAMAARYLAEVRAVQASGPYCLGGYSGGGIIALEMARAVQEAGERVGLLALIDTPAPDLGSRTFRQRWHGRMRRLRRLGPGYAARWLAARTAKLAANMVGRAPPTMPLDEGSIDMTPAFDSAWAVYNLRSYDGDAVMFRSSIRDYDFYPPEFGWRRWITGDVDVCYVPTDHYGMMYEPAIRILCDDLGRRLEQLRSPGPA
jgi:thioesterase domain-containing protein